MKKSKILKRTIASVLVITTIAVGLPYSSDVRYVEAAEPITSEDFEGYGSSVELSDRWESIAIDPSFTNGTTDSAAIVSGKGVDGSNAARAARVNGEGNARKILTTLKGDYAPQGVVNEFSLYGYAEDGWYDYHFALVPYYEDADTRLVVDFQLRGDGTIDFRAKDLASDIDYTLHETKTDESVNFNCTNPNAEQYDPWLKYTFRYIYEPADGGTYNITIHMDVCNTYETITDYWVYEMCGVSNVFRTGFTASVDSNNAHSYIDNIRYDVTGDEELANEYQTNHRDILTKTEFSSADIEAYNAAKEAYDALPELVKDKMPEMQKKLEDIKSGIIAVSPTSTFFSFEESAHDFAWENIRVNISGQEEVYKAATVISDAVYSADGESAVYQPAVSDKYKSPIVLTPDASVWPLQSLTKFEFTFRMENQWYDNSSAIFPIIIENEGEELPYVIGVQYSFDGEGETRGFYFRHAAGTNQPAWEHFIAGDKTLDVTGWLKFSVEYDYSKLTDQKIIVTYTVTDQNEYSAEATVTYTIPNLSIENSCFRIGFGSLFGEAKNYYKDLNLTFAVTDKDNALQFMSNYKALLDMDAFEEGQQSQLKMMAEAYAGLTDGAKEIIDDLGRLDSFIQIMRSTSLDYDGKSDLEDYLETYEKVFSGKISADDMDLVQAAMVDYSGLSDVAKMILYPEKLQLELLVRDKDIIRDMEDYSSFKHDFEDDINPFYEVTKPTEYAVNEIVTDPDDPTGENKVLKLSGKDDAFVLKYWPTLGSVKSATFRMKTSSVLPTRSRIYAGYESEDNFYSASYGSPMEGMYSVFGDAMTDGVRETSQTNSVEIDIYQWLEISMVFSDSSVMLTAKDEDGNTTSWTVAYTRGGAFGFGYATSKDWVELGNPMYIDDLVIEFHDTAGDFDKNDPIEDIHVYYSGNTFLTPNSTVVLNGEQLFTTAQDEVLMQQVPNVADKSVLKDTSTPVQVVAQEDYSTDANLKGTKAQTAVHQFEDATATKAELLTRTKTTMDFVIPESFEEGIYAIKLLPKVKDAEAKVLYINRPDISFVTGDEGSIATQGGTIRIVGNNLVPTGKKEDVSVRLIDVKSGTNYNLPVAAIFEDDMYSLSMDIPTDLPYGEYEVYVHNGYGDGTCWSDASTITVGAAPKSTWKLAENWFNVKDYGAVGDGLTNDTPAIIKALQDAASNGGGTVYIPKGKYRVVTTLAIPEYVSLRGEGMDKTVLAWSADRWDYGKAPKTLISIIGNTEICDIMLSGTRHANIITLADSGAARYVSDKSRDNVYLTNVNVAFYPALGYLTDANTYRETDTATQALVTEAVDAELRASCIFDFRSGISNLQLNNFHYENDRKFISGGSAGVPTMRIFGDQFQIHNSSWIGYSLGSTSYGAIIEDNDLEAAAFNPSGNGFYFARNYLHDSTGNNRELLVTDGEPTLNHIQAQFIGAREDMMKEAFGQNASLDDTIYLLTSDNSGADNTYQGYIMAVSSGQGVGQVRHIIESGVVEVTQNGVKVERTYVRIDSPFTVAPNRKSRVIISEPRDTWFFVDNDFYNGGASGSWGMMINAVWDGNTFRKHEGQYFFANMAIIWYNTLKNQTHSDPSYAHHGGGGSNTGTWGDLVENRNYRALFDMSNTLAPYGGVCFAVRECDFEGYGFQIKQGQTFESLAGFVMENCNFSDRDDDPIRIDDDYISCGSLLFRDNSFDGTKGDFNKSEYPDVYETDNAEGYNIIMIINSDYSAEVILMGDVNLDGKVSLKDCTLIRMYLDGSMELEEAQKVRADVSKDSNISLMDVSIIKYWILTDFEDVELEDVLGDGSGSQGGITTENQDGWLDADF